MDAINQAFDIKENIDDKIQFNLVTDNSLTDDDPMNASCMVEKLTEEESKILGNNLWRIILIAQDGIPSVHRSKDVAFDQSYSAAICGAVKAIRAFDATRGMTVDNFIAFCARRRVIVFWRTQKSRFETRMTHGTPDQRGMTTIDKKPSVEAEPDLDGEKKLIREIVSQIMADESQANFAAAVAIVFKYGLDGGEPLSGSEIGRVFGYSRQRASQVISKAQARIAKFLISEPKLLEFAGYSFAKKTVKKKAGKSHATNG